MCTYLFILIKVQSLNPITCCDPDSCDSFHMSHSYITSCELATLALLGMASMHLQYSGMYVCLCMYSSVHVHATACMSSCLETQT